MHAVTGSSPGLLWLLSSLAAWAVARSCDALRAFTLSVPGYCGSVLPERLFRAGRRSPLGPFRGGAETPSSPPRWPFRGGADGESVSLFGWFCQGGGEMLRSKVGEGRQSRSVEPSAPDSTAFDRNPIRDETARSMNIGISIISICPAFVRPMKRSPNRPLIVCSTNRMRR